MNIYLSKSFPPFFNSKAIINTFSCDTRVILKKRISLCEVAAGAICLNGRSAEEPVMYNCLRYNHADDNVKYQVSKRTLNF